MDDSWEKLENDIGDIFFSRRSACSYFGRKLLRHDCEGCPSFGRYNCYDAIIEDIVARAKRLAGVE